MLVCDLCRKRVQAYDSLILYSKRIDYCKECERKVKKIKIGFQEEIKDILKKDGVNADKKIKDAEMFLIEKIKFLCWKGIYKR